MTMLASVMNNYTADYL